MSFFENEEHMHSKLCGREKLVNKIPKPSFLSCDLEKEQQNYKNKAVLSLNTKCKSLKSQLLSIFDALTFSNISTFLYINI